MKGEAIFYSTCPAPHNPLLPVVARTEGPLGVNATAASLRSSICQDTEETAASLSADRRWFKPPFSPLRLPSLGLTLLCMEGT